MCCQYSYCLVIQIRMVFNHLKRQGTEGTPIDTIDAKPRRGRRHRTTTSSRARAESTTNVNDARANIDASTRATRMRAIAS